MEQIDYKTPPEVVLASNPSTPEDFYSLARFLAYRGRLWTPDHRHSLIKKLQPYAAVAGPSILARAQEFPREDVLDAATEALDLLPNTLEGVILLETWLESAAPDHIHVKEICARLLGLVDHGKPDLAKRAVVCLTKMLNDPADVEMRVAAIWPLARLWALRPLIDALETETDDYVRGDLVDAIRTLI